MDRTELEHALQRPLSPAEVHHPSALAGRRVSFVSYHVWRYALIEIVVLTLLLAGVCLVLARLGLAFTVPILFTAEVCLFFFLKWYSPAWLDADFFYQRILVDTLAGLGLVFLWLSFPVVLFSVLLVSIGVYLLERRRQLFGKTSRACDSSADAP